MYWVWDMKNVLRLEKKNVLRLKSSGKSITQDRKKKLLNPFKNDFQIVLSKKKIDFGWWIFQTQYVFFFFFLTQYVFEIPNALRFFFSYTFFSLHVKFVLQEVWTLWACVLNKCGPLKIDFFGMFGNFFYIISKR